MYRKSKSNNFSKSLIFFILTFILLITIAGCSDNNNTGENRDNEYTDTPTDDMPGSTSTDKTSGTISTNPVNSKIILIKSLANGYGFAIKVGDSKQMTVKITPENATNKKLEWATSDESIAVIDPVTGVLTAKSPGSVKVYVYAKDGSNVKDSCTVNVVGGTESWKPTSYRKIKDPSLPYYLYFERDAYTISVYGQGDDGYYSKLVKTISSSRGRTINMTPTGHFKLTKQDRWYLFKIGHYWTQYCIKYSDDVYLHGPLYREASGDTMHITEYNRIGTASTSGCLAMRTADIKWIWDNCPNGTPLEIVSGAPIGNVAEHPVRIPDDGPAIDPSDPEF